MFYEINLGNLILALTFFAIFWTAIETRRIASETINTNLRPLILRSGQIIDWAVLSVEDMEKLKNPQPTLEFINLKNTAVDITGTIVLDKKEYPLIFHGKILGSELKGATTTALVFNLKWGWLPAGGMVSATYSQKQYAETKKDNQISLFYKDIEGNSYTTTENREFSSASDKISDSKFLTRLFGVGLISVGGILTFF